MENNLKRTMLLFTLFMTLSIPSGLWAQQAGYSQTNLVSNTAGVGKTTDTQLSNPWGISIFPGQDFWIANNNGGTSTLYDAQGNKNTLVVNIPGAAKNPNGNCTPGCPTGNVANTNGSYFGGGSFIFDTEDGIIANWTGGTSAVVAFDNSASGAVYKGLALLNSTFLLAANFNSGKVDVYDRNFNSTSLSGSFTDPKLPAGLAPHGIHVIGNQIYVAYAMQDAAKHDAEPGSGGYLRLERKFREHLRSGRKQTQRALGSSGNSCDLRNIPRRDIGRKFWRWHHQCVRHNWEVSRPAHRLFGQGVSESRLVGYDVWRRRPVG
jgi:hypothetical protein